MTNTVNLGLPLIDANQNQKYLTHNLALAALDALVQIQVQSLTNTPPGSPTEGQVWIAGASPTGAWAGKAGKLAAWQSGAWVFYTPHAGYIAFNVATGQGDIYNGTAWVSLLSVAGGTLIGQLLINLNAVTPQAGQTGWTFRAAQADTTPTRLELDSFAAASFFTGVRANGTAAAPTTLVNGNEITGFNAWGYDGAGFVGPYASARTYAGETWSGTHHGTYLDFATTPIASSTLTSGIQLREDGGLISTGVTAGSKGAGTANFAQVWEAGVRVAKSGANTDITSLSGLTTINGGPLSGFLNRIINGGMDVDQRNVGASVTTVASAATAAKPVDMWTIQGNGSSPGTFTGQQQTSTPPNNFTSYLRFTTTLADAAPASGAVYVAFQRIEGLNCRDLGWGTASAKNVTLSFQARSSITGTFSGSIRNSANNRSYPFQYTISAANTWTPCSITIPGDTTGTWLVTNGVGINVTFAMGFGSSVAGTVNTWAASNYVAATGSTQPIATTSATLDITAAQLEAGSTASAFEVRSYQQALLNCQRYYEKTYEPSVVPGTSGSNPSIVVIQVPTNVIPSDQCLGNITWKVPKRTIPTVTIYGFSGTSGTVSNTGGTDLAAASGTATFVGTNACTIWQHSGGTVTTSGLAILCHAVIDASL